VLATTAATPRGAAVTVVNEKEALVSDRNIGGASDLVAGVDRAQYSFVMAPLPMPTNYTALDLLVWHEEGSLRLSPKFQRRSVWKPAAKSFFIDTLLRGFPVPPLHIRMSEIAWGKPVREVIDGQQRLRALFDFLNGKLRLSRNLDAHWAGKRLSDLNAEEQETLRLTNFHVYQYQAIEDEVVLQIFARMNTYSVALNRQELRNGKYFGKFKQLVYQLSSDYLRFWREAGIFSEAAIARMHEAELVSELLILQMDGIQDKKKSVDSFYSHLEEQWSEIPITWTISRGKTKVDAPASWLSRVEAEQRFRHCMAVLSETVGGFLRETGFARIPQFYTLYCAIYHAEYGLPRTSLPRPEILDWSEVGPSLTSAMGEIGEILSYDRDDEALTRWQRDFIVASARQTDNLTPREIRLRTLWELAGLGA
jgi:hypothetical protein